MGGECGCCSRACLPSSTRSGFSLSLILANSFATASGCSVPGTRGCMLGLRKRRTVVINEDVDRAVGPHRQRRAQHLLVQLAAAAHGHNLLDGPLLLQLHRLRAACVGSNDCGAPTSSTAISSNGFIDCLTPSVTTPVLSGLTRTWRAAGQPASHSRHFLRFARKIRVQSCCSAREHATQAARPHLHGVVNGALARHQREPQAGHAATQGYAAPVEIR